MGSITTRFVMLVATAAVAPLMLYGAVSVYSLRAGTRQSVTGGNLNVAGRAAEQIDQYMGHHVTVLRSIAADLRDTRLEPWQEVVILKNHVLDLDVFRELTLFASDGSVIATSRLGSPRLDPPPQTSSDQPIIADVSVDDDFLPTTTVSLPVAHREGRAWLAGQVSLEELWRMVDRIRVGQEGFALVVAEGGQLIAHGDPDQKPRIAAGENLSDHALVLAAAALRSTGSTESTNASTPQEPLVLETEATAAVDCWRWRPPYLRSTGPSS